MDNLAIARIDHATAGEYQARLPGSDATARLTWVLRNDSRGPVRVADHTLVPKEFEGRGIAGQLLRALIEDARAQGFRIEPACAYVAAQFQRHPEWADLKAE